MTRPSAFSFLRPGLSDPAIKINPFYAEFISQDIIWYISVYCRQTGHKYIYFNSEWTGQYVKYILFVDGLFYYGWTETEAWIINDILYFLWDVITQICPNLNGDSTKPPLDLILRGSNYICMSI